MFAFYLMPQVYKFESTYFDNSKVMLGKNDLHSPQMDSPHLEIRHKNEGVFIKDVTANRKTTTYFGQRKKSNNINASAYLLTQPVSLLIGENAIDISPENNQLFLTVKQSNEQFVFDENGLVQKLDGDYVKLGMCRTSQYISGPLMKMASEVRNFFNPVSLQIGGALLCDKRLRLLGDSLAHIKMIDDQFVLHSSSPGDIFIREIAGENPSNDWLSLANASLPSEGFFWAGRTLFKAQWSVVDEADRLLIEALASKPLLLESQLTPKPNEVWTPIYNQSPSLKFWHLTILGFCMVLLSMWLFWKWLYLRQSYQPTKLFAYLTAVSGLTVLLLEKLNVLFIPIEWSVYLLLFSICLIANKRWHAILAFIALCGVFNQLALASAAGTENMFFKAREQIVAFTIFCFLVLLFRAFDTDLYTVLKDKIFKYKITIYIALGVFLSGLLAQLILGSETGIPGLPNPIETLKMAMSLLAAIFMGTFVFYHGSLIAKQFWKLLLVGLGFLSMAGLFLISMSDFSPSLILLAMSCAIVTGLTIIFSTRDNITFNKLAFVVPVVTIVILSSGSIYLNNKIDNITIDTYQLSGLPAVDRWKTLKLSDENYVNAYQINQAKIAQVNAGFFPNMNWEEGFAVPAIQDDFAITHFMARLGTFLTTVFVLCFAGLVAYFILFSFVSMYHSIKSRQLLSTRLEVLQLAIFCSLMSCALAAHIFVNISSNLSFMPVMGQPLAFLSIANSHLVFFIFPTLVAISLLEAQIKRIN